MFDIVTIAVSILLGLVGGIANVVVWAKAWVDLKEFGAFKTIVIGGIVGALYAFLHSDYGFPNTIMTVIAGYFGTDFLRGIIEKFGKKENGGTK